MKRNRVETRPGWKCTALAGARGAVTGALCVLLAGQPLLAQGGRGHRGPTAAGHSTDTDARVLHALNRLTFGPTPGEVGAVQEMGLTRWFEMQLNPGSIDDSSLDARLATFPAMHMSQMELIGRYPSDQMIRQLAQRNAPVPMDPVVRAIYSDQLAIFKMRQEKNQEKAAATAAASGPMASGGSMDGSMAAPQNGSSAAAGDMTKPAPTPDIDGPAPAAHVEGLYKDLDAVKILNLPPDQRMARVVAMTGTEFIAFRTSLSGAELAQFADGMTPEQREEFAAMQNTTRMVSAEVLQERMMRDIYSERQLEAVMTDFWLNHFNVYIRKNGDEPYLLPSYERDVIRPNALGKFEDLLVATAKSPAMQMYLDNWQSIGPDSKAAQQSANSAAKLDNPKARAALKDRGLNENYGRELMELHTLGVNGGYTQKDVTEVSKVFTGWTITPPLRGAEFQFDERRHEPGPKTVLGKTIQENGMGEGLEVLHMLATSPATAKFISRKLAVRFVSDNPPQPLVDRMTKSWMDSGGDIKTVLRTMFESPEFWGPEAPRSKVKTPEEFVISAARASGAQVTNAQGLVGALDKLGMPFYGMQTPNGYSWKAEDWVSTGALVNRMNFALVLANDRVNGTKSDWTKLLASTVPAKSASATAASAKAQDPELALKESKLERVVLGEAASDRTRAAVLAQASDSTAPLQAQKDFQGGPGRGAVGAIVGGGYNPPMPVAGSAGQKPGAAKNNTQTTPDDRQAAVMAGLLLGSPEFQRR